MIKLEMKLNEKRILKTDEIGVSFTLSDSELKELGFKSIKEVIDLLFGS